MRVRIRVRGAVLQCVDAQGPFLQFWAGRVRGQGEARVFEHLPLAEHGHGGARV